MVETIVMYIGVPPFKINGTHVSTALVVLKPASHGTVSVSPKDSKQLLLDPNYLHTDVDRYVWRESIRQQSPLIIEDAVPDREVVAEETPPAGFEPLRVEMDDNCLDNRFKAQAVPVSKGPDIVLWEQ
ncbi:hypothetical protein F5Y15DRAFT_320619 [Xylariaceae sp. FL0016]|nr:hypothetical protein F5Y15DRAFT_320619 [Xylariaceae sp. FL0016]